MEFPFGHQSHSHTHHHQRDEEGERQNYPPPDTAFSSFDPSPPPSYHGGDKPLPPQFQPTHVYHTSHVPPPQFPPDPDYTESDFRNRPPPPPPPESFGYDYPSEALPHPPPSFATPTDNTTSVYHVSHDQDYPTETHHSYRPHMPSIHHHHAHHSSSESELFRKPTVKVYTKADPNYSLTIREGKVVLAPYDPADEFQHWYKDEKYSTRVKDEEGCPCFSLVNKATGQAMKHSIGATHPVQLIPYNADVLDESILWTESKDIGDGYRAIRMVNNVHLNVDALHGDKKSGGVHEGTIIVLWAWNKGDNQLWKIVPHLVNTRYSWGMTGG